MAKGGKIVIDNGKLRYDHTVDKGLAKVVRMSVGLDGSVSSVSLIHSYVYKSGEEAAKRLLAMLDDSIMKQVECMQEELVKTYGLELWGVEQLKGLFLNDGERQAFYVTYGSKMAKGLTPGEMLQEGDERINPSMEHGLLIIYHKIHLLKTLHCASCTLFMPLYVLLGECSYLLQGERESIVKEYGSAFMNKVDKICKSQSVWAKDIRHYIRNFIRDGIASTLSTFTHEYDLGDRAIMLYENASRGYALKQFDHLKDGVKAYLKRKGIDKNRHTIGLLCTMWALIRYAVISAWNYNDTFFMIVGYNGKYPPIETEHLHDMQERLQELIGSIFGKGYNYKELLVELTNIEALKSTFDYFKEKTRADEFVNCRTMASDEYFYYYIGRHVKEYQDNGKLNAVGETDLKLLVKSCGLDKMFPVRFAKDIKAIAEALVGEDMESARWVGKLVRGLVEGSQDYGCISKLKKYYI